MSDQLSLWNDTPTRRAIVEFVQDVTDPASLQHVPSAERIAVFDNDGTLWCEKPMPVELGFILLRLAEIAEQDAALRDRQPWKAAYHKDYAWLSDAMVKHYHGDESDVKVLIGGMLHAFAGMAVDAYGASADAFLQRAGHPTLDRLLRDCGYAPMVELLRYLEANGFTNYIASGGDRDFMRPVTQAIYGIPPERVIGSSNALQYLDDEQGGALVYKAEPDVFDDGPIKPVRIWSRIGRRPILAVGNSNGDMQMLQFAGGLSLPALRVLVLHDDADREFAYVSGAEKALEQANARDWTVVSMKADWRSVFADASAAVSGA